MAFLEEQRKKKLAASKPNVGALGGGSATTSKGSPSPSKTTTTTAPSTIGARDENNISSQPQKKTLSDMWRFVEGSGTLGNYTLCRHSPSGLVIEMWQEGSGSFAFRRATGAKVKYCSSYGSLRESSHAQAPTRPMPPRPFLVCGRSPLSRCLFSVSQCHCRHSCTCACPRRVRSIACVRACV